MDPPQGGGYQANVTGPAWFRTHPLRRIAALDSGDARPWLTPIYTLGCGHPTSNPLSALHTARGESIMSWW